MSLGLESVPGIIASSTGGYLVEFAPLFVLIGGLVLALTLIGVLVDIFTLDRNQKTSDNND